MNISNENSLLNQNIVYDLTPFSHLDYPNHLSCIVWMVGCNMRCDYCYNKDIVFSKQGKFSFADMLTFLKNRIGLLDAVVLSGGEATAHDLIPFAIEVKKLGFLIKLDTNGTNFEQIKKLIQLNLVDYIALDYKAPKYKFTQITHSNQYELFSQSLDFLIVQEIDFEVRTTLHIDLLDEVDINFIMDDLHQRGYEKTYYIQDFMKTDDNIAGLKQSDKSFDKTLLGDYFKVVWR
ncbi:MAG: anaerobic ribonucleoside-triphosphate reductase activating protein [Campylobacterota bacterium]|nr:anaerobic ribonucleoside-triphosphate reductase activating protein [Campylobacterota bacterium]